MRYYFLLILVAFFRVGKGTGENGKETFEIESAVIRCENPDAMKDDDFRVVNWKPRPLTSFNVPVKPGPHDPNSALDMDVENDVDLNITRMTKCVSEVIITVKVTHTGNIPLDDSGTLIKLDHALDERSDKSVRLGNPIAIKIQEGPLFAVYPLKYLETVNAKPSEVVTNYKNLENSGKCDGDICGAEKGETLQNPAGGFCCSCDDADNFKGQLRGGYKCGNNGTDHFYSSHCFHLSDYWYAIFEIGPPEMLHQVYIQVYESEEKEDGTLQWKTSGVKGQLAKIDSMNNKSFLDAENLSITYRKVESRQEEIDKLNSGQNDLLIPTLFYASTLTSMKDDRKHEMYVKHPVGDEFNSAGKDSPAQFKNGMDDAVLVVPKKLIGGKCSQVGVTWESFISQPSPCREASGTCLKNQPFDLWESDKTESTAPHYRLKHFGKVHDPAPFKRIQDGMYFVTEHRAEAVAYIDIQLPADKLEVMRPGYTAQLVSVLSGCSRTSGGKLIVEVANAEQVPAFYGVNLLSCTDHLPLQKSELRVIDALRISTFQLDLHYAPPFQLGKRAKCSVGVLNQYNEVVAFRTVIFSPGETCICSLNCKCTCAEEPKFRCIPLSDDEILSAGFPDPQEFDNYGDELSDFLTPENLLYTIAVVALILILLGICKGLAGICGCRKAQKFGLWYFENRPRKLRHYYEKEYARLDVVYDELGNPVDPFTKLPTVKRLTRFEEFALNLVFFLLLPIFCCWSCWCWCFCSRKKLESTPGKSPNHEAPSDADGDKGEKGDKRSHGKGKSASRKTLHKGSSPTRTPFGSPADSYNDLRYESVDTFLSTPSHRTLFSSSTTDTPYGSWHRNPGQGPPETYQNYPLNKGYQTKKDEEHSGLAGSAHAPNKSTTQLSETSTSLPGSSQQSSTDSSSLRSTNSHPLSTHRLKSRWNSNTVLDSP